MDVISKDSSPVVDCPRILINSKTVAGSSLISEGVQTSCALRTSASDERFQLLIDRSNSPANIAFFPSRAITGETSSGNSGISSAESVGDSYSRDASVDPMIVTFLC
jgi:hypothetical protein